VDFKHSKEEEEDCKTEMQMVKYLIYIISRSTTLWTMSVSMMCLVINTDE